MDEELSHSAPTAVGILRGVEPVASAHERPINDLVELVGIIVKLGESRGGIAVGEDAGKPCLVGCFSRAYEVDEPARIWTDVGDVAAHDAVEHGRSRRGVERHVVADLAAGTAPHVDQGPPRLDRRIADVDGVRFDPVAPQLSGGEDPREVRDICEVIDPGQVREFAGTSTCIPRRSRRGRATRTPGSRDDPGSRRGSMKPRHASGGDAAMEPRGSQSRSLSYLG